MLPLTVTVVVRGVPLVGVIVRDWGGGTKVAVTFLSCRSTLRLQVPEPLQPPPLQPLNLEPPTGLAVRITGRSKVEAISIVQVPEPPFLQLIPPMLLVTVPSPAPEILTVNVCWCKSVCVWAATGWMYEKTTIPAAISATTKKGHAARMELGKRRCVSKGLAKFSYAAGTRRQTGGASSFGLVAPGGGSVYSPASIISPG